MKEFSNDCCNKSTISELEHLLSRPVSLPPNAKSKKPHHISKDVLSLNSGMQVDISDSTTNKDPGYFGPDLSAAISHIQLEVERLRDRVTIYKQDDTAGRIYETIGNKNASKEQHFVVHRSNATKLNDSNSVSMMLQKNGFTRLSCVFNASSNPLRRLLWCLILIGCLGMLGYSIWNRLLLFLYYPVTSDTQDRHVDLLQFPVVSICNLNMYRLTHVVPLGLYDVIQSSEVNPKLFFDNQNLITNGQLPYDTFLRNVSHAKDIFINSCSYRGKRCTHKDFKEKLTPHGLCYVFHPSNTKKSIGIPETGLRLLLNIEQYEYLLGPKSAVGARVFVQDEKSGNLITENGLFVSVGSSTTFKLREHQYRDVSSSLGNCKGNTGSESCEIECINMHIYGACSCIMPYASFQTGKQRVCSIKDFFTCVEKVIQNLSFSDLRCGCHESCNKRIYDARISTASLSTYAAESFVRSIPDFKQMEKIFQSARDMYHKKDRTIFTHDLDSLKFIANSLENANSNINSFVTNIIPYDEEFDKGLTRLDNAVRTMNRRISYYYKAFLKMDHITFVDFNSTVLKNLNGVSKKATLNKVDITSGDIETLISDILDLINELTVSEKFDTFSTTSTLEEIKNGATLFRDKLLTGYGQQYVEFRRRKLSYMSMVDRIISLVRELNTSLSDIKQIVQYDIRKTITNKLITNEKFDLIMRNSDQLTLTTAKELVDEMRKLREQYRSDRNKVVELRETVLNIEKKLPTSKDTIKSLLRNTRDRATSLNSSIEWLKQHIIYIKKLYSSDQLNKSQLSKLLFSEDVGNVLSKLNININSVKSGVENIKKAGAQLAREIEPISARFLDFNKLKKDEIDSTFERLSFPSVQEEYGRLILSIDETSRSMETFKNDLSDYYDGNTIGADFFQNNFLQLDIHFTDMTETVTTQRMSYNIFDLACDLGGLLALFLGASTLMIFELLFTVIEYCKKKSHGKYYNNNMEVNMRPQVPR